MEGNKYYIQPVPSQTLEGLAELKGKFAQKGMHECRVNDYSLSLVCLEPLFYLMKKNYSEVPGGYSHLTHL